MNNEENATILLSIFTDILENFVHYIDPIDENKCHFSNFSCTIDHGLSYLLLILPYNMIEKEVEEILKIKNNSKYYSQTIYIASLLKYRYSKDLNYLLFVY